MKQISPYFSYIWQEIANSSGSIWLRDQNESEIQILTGNMMDIYQFLFTVCRIRDGISGKQVEQGPINNTSSHATTTWLTI